MQRQSSFVASFPSHSLSLSLFVSAAPFHSHERLLFTEIAFNGYVSINLKRFQ